MSENSIEPIYEAIFEHGAFTILGMDKISGESMVINNLPFDEKTVLNFVKILNKNKVSVVHAKDVIRDIVLSSFTE